MLMGPCLVNWEESRCHDVPDLLEELEFACLAGVMSLLGISSQNLRSEVLVSWSIHISRSWHQSKRQEKTRSPFSL
jgi:Tfp pilus assembly protein PilN